MTDTATDRLAPGTLLADRFEVRDLLGEGAMGVVYRGADREGDREGARPVAIKVLKRQLVQSKEFVARFKREARAASRFRHDAAVKVFATGETEDRLPWIAMELVEGRSLREIIAADAPLAPGRACNLAKQLLEALGAAHRVGIVHRDMKPDNIRVVVDADGIERPKILDFGVAKFLRGDVGDVSGGLKTKTGVVLGTPKYMAPEQVRGEAIDGRADVYAMGAMLYEMLSGHPPFEAEDVFGFVAMHLKQEVVPLTQRFPDLDVPHEVDEVVLRMLHKDPKERPDDAAALAAELERFRVEDPRAAEKAKALRRGICAVVAAGAAGAAACALLAPRLAIAASGSALGLGVGAAIAAQRFGRPSVYGYVKRVAVVAGALALPFAVAAFWPGGPGAIVAASFGLAALTDYAGFLLVWSAPSRLVRALVAGIAAPLLALLLFPVQVQPPGETAEAYFTAVVRAAPEDPQKAAMERQAQRDASLSVLAVALLFGAASVVLPRPGAARRS